jgi:hypothetical protein
MLGVINRKNRRIEMSQELRHAIDRVIANLEVVELSIDDVIFVCEENGEASVKTKMDEVIDKIREIYFALNDVIEEFSVEDTDEEEDL